MSIRIDDTKCCYVKCYPMLLAADGNGKAMGVKKHPFSIYIYIHYIDDPEWGWKNRTVRVIKMCRRPMRLPTFTSAQAE